MRPETLFEPEFLPPQHEPTDVQVAEQRADRGPLWSPLSLIPIARTRACRAGVGKIYVVAAQLLPHE